MGTCKPTTHLPKQLVYSIVLVRCDDTGNRYQQRLKFRKINNGFVIYSVFQTDVLLNGVTIYRHISTSQASLNKLKRRTMSVNDVPRDSFGRVHLDAPPDYSATCSNNGEHSGQAFGHSVMTADLVQEKSKICPLNSSYIARNENDTENHEVV